LGNPISIETLENYGVFDVFSSVRYAPSHKNFQPWRFVLKGSEVHAYMVKSDEDSRSLIDMGVILFYMEEMLKTMGIEKKWTIDLKDDGKYYYIGSFTL
ncbi:nitroreductase family protein, partial [uncultured Peptoniphilus sp.]